jgi:DNA helicase-2/ATP-dependent DNA helicase PcrA
VWLIRGGPASTLTFGTVMHTVVATLIRELQRNPKLEFAAVREIYEREWKAAGYEDSWQEQEYKKDGLEQLRAFFDTTRAAPPQVVQQEKTFELSLDDNILVTGRIDQINRLDAAREVEIVDYKTGGPKDEKAAEKSLQLSLYALAAQEQLGLTPTRMTFYNLTTNEPVSAERSAADLEEALGEVAEVAASLRARSFPAVPGFLCRNCDFRAICPEHEEP